MKSLSARQARRELGGLLNEVAATGEPVMIIGPRSAAVLVSASEWSSISETLYLLSVPGLRDDIKDGMATAAEDLFDEIDW